MEERGIEHTSEDLPQLAFVVLLVAASLRLQRSRQLVEKLAAGQRQRAFQLRKRPLRIVLQRRSGEPVHHRPAEIQRAQLHQPEPGLFEPGERTAPQLPHTRAVDLLVVEREPGATECIDVTADRALMDAAF